MVRLIRVAPDGTLHRCPRRASSRHRCISPARRLCVRLHGHHAHQPRRVVVVGGRRGAANSPTSTGAFAAGMIEPEHFVVSTTTVSSWTHGCCCPPATNRSPRCSTSTVAPPPSTALGSSTSSRCTPGAGYGVVACNPRGSERRGPRLRPHPGRALGRGAPARSRGRPRGARCRPGTVPAPRRRSAWASWVVPTAGS